MKTNSLIVVFLFLAFFSFSQEEDQSKGWYYGPNISYGAINGNHYKELGFVPMSDYHQVSYSIGGDRLYAFGRKHLLNFGVHYRESSFSYSEYMGWDTVYDPNKINTIYNRYTSSYIALPVQMNFCLLKGEISPYIITGISPEIYFTDRTYRKTVYNNGKMEERRIRGYYHPNLNLYWQFGIGVDVNLKKAKFRAFIYNSSDAPALFSLVLGSYFSYSIHTGISYYLKTSRH
jgi:hypothetical protein